MMEEKKKKKKQSRPGGKEMGRDLLRASTLLRGVIAIRARAGSYETKVPPLSVKRHLSQGTYGWGCSSWLDRALLSNLISIPTLSELCWRTNRHDFICLARCRPSPVPD